MPLWGPTVGRSPTASHKLYQSQDATCASRLLIHLGLNQHVWNGLEKHLYKASAHLLPPQQPKHTHSISQMSQSHGTSEWDESQVFPSLNMSGPRVQGAQARVVSCAQWKLIFAEISSRPPCGSPGYSLDTRGHCSPAHLSSQKPLLGFA